MSIGLRRRAKRSANLIGQRSRTIERALGEQQLELSVQPIARPFGSAAGVDTALELLPSRDRIAALEQHQYQQRDAMGHRQIDAQTPQGVLVDRRAQPVLGIDELAAPVQREPHPQADPALGLQ